MGMANRLLVVDDEPSIARVIETAARQIGLEVMAITDTDEFEKALQTHRPTIIMLDIAMPGRDGVELLGYLVAANYAGKVVVMSGSHPSYIQMSSAIARNRGLDLAGALPKPFRKQAVADLLTRLVAAPAYQRTE